MQFGVHYRLGKPTAGGGFTYVDSIMKELAEQVGGTRHRMLVYGTGASLPDHIRKPGVTFLDLRTAPDALLAFWSAAALRRWRGHPFSGLQRSVEYYLQRRLAATLRRAGVQFVWSLSPYLHTMEIPYAVTVWDVQFRKQGFFPEVSERGEWRQRQQIYEEMLSRATYVIASNQTGCREIGEFFHVPPQRVLSLPHFTPTWALNPPAGNGSEISRKLGVQPGNFLLYPAQFWPHKNHIRIIQAVELLRAEHGRKIDVVFVGSDCGNKNHIQSEVTRRNLDDQVRFAGFLSQGDLAQLYRDALCLTYASCFGPENLPPLEAFALGCPVVCSRYDGAVDQLGNAALYFEPTEARQLVDRILELFHGKTRQELIDRGLARARDWTAAEYTKRVFELLDTFERTRECWP